MCGDLNGGVGGAGPLEQLQRVAADISLPIISSAASRGAWPEPIAKNVTDAMGKLISATCVAVGQVLLRLRRPRRSRTLSECTTTTHHRYTAEHGCPSPPQPTQSAGQVGLRANASRH